MTVAKSIDGAANGYARHRFVRALAASFVVGSTFGILALTFIVTIDIVMRGEWNLILAAPLGAVLVALIFILPIVLMVAFAGAVIDVLHRRLVGLALFLGGLLLLLAALVLLFMSAASLLGYDMTTPSQPQPLSTREALVICGFGVISTPIAYELLRAGWWQFTIGAAGFRSVRGWRPPAWRLFTSFRRHLGLPSFLSYVGKKRRTVTALYFGVAVLNLGLLMALMLPVLIGGAESKPQPDVNPPAVYASMVGLILLNLFGIGNFLATLADKRATALYQHVREWDARPPIVFLRAFDQDDHKLKARSGDAFARSPGGVGRARTLDEILLEHASPYGPVIAIGDPRDPTPPLGAARVFVPGEGTGWQDVVRSLAAASKAIVMCPNSGEGVQWELDLIAQAQGRLRVIFLASPDLNRAANLALFQRLVPSMPDIKLKQTPIAAYMDHDGWRVLTAKRASVESYTAALNTALQALFGMQGTPVSAPR